MPEAEFSTRSLPRMRQRLKTTAVGKSVRRPPLALWVLALLLLLLPAAALQAKKQPLWGYGVRSCQAYAAAAKAADGGDAAEYQRYEDWLTGFLSGLNLSLGEDVLRGSGIETAMGRARSHCKGNPKDDFFNATMDFVRMLGSVR